MNTADCSVEVYEEELREFIQLLRPPRLQNEWITSIPDCPRELLGKLTVWARALPWPSGWFVAKCQRFSRSRNGQNEKMVRVELLKLNPHNVAKTFCHYRGEAVIVLRDNLKRAVDLIRRHGLEFAGPEIESAIYLLNAYATHYEKIAEEVAEFIQEQRARGAQLLSEFPNDRD